MFYCMFYFTCDRSLSKVGLRQVPLFRRPTFRRRRRQHWMRLSYWSAGALRDRTSRWISTSGSTGTTSDFASTTATTSSVLATRCSTASGGQTRSSPMQSLQDSIRLLPRTLSYASNPLAWFLRVLGIDHVCIFFYHWISWRFCWLSRNALVAINRLLYARPG